MPIKRKMALRVIVDGKSQKVIASSWEDANRDRGQGNDEIFYHFVKTNGTEHMKFIYLNYISIRMIEVNIKNSTLYVYRQSFGPLSWPQAYSPLTSFCVLVTEERSTSEWTGIACQLLHSTTEGPSDNPLSQETAPCHHLGHCSICPGGHRSPQSPCPVYPLEVNKKFIWEQKGV